MSAIKYIGMDVHVATSSIAVLDAHGKLMMEVTMATQASALVDFIRGLSGTLQVTFEEGTSAHWLYTLLEPHVAKVVVCDPRQNPRRLGEKKSDRLDARKLAELLRLGSLKPVYHGNALGPALKELARSYRTLVSDTARVMNRLKALYRARGIRCAGTRVYSPHFRDQWLEQLREPGVRGDAGREPQASRAEDSVQHSRARSGARGLAARPVADALPLSWQTAVVDLRRAGLGDPHERRLPEGGRPSDAFAQAGLGPGTERQSQPYPERDL
jgi:hypothetical protein